MKWSNSEMFISTAVPILIRNTQIKGFDRLLSVNTRQSYFSKKEMMMNSYLLTSSRSYRKYMMVRDVSILCLDCTFSCQPKFYLFRSLPYFLGKTNMGVAMLMHWWDGSSLTSWAIFLLYQGLGTWLTWTDHDWSVADDGTGQFVCSDTRPSIFLPHFCTNSFLFI